MPHYTPEEYAALLTRTYTPRFPRDNRPRVVSDTTDKGAEILDLILPHPEDGRFSVSLTAHTLRGAVAFIPMCFALFVKKPIPRPFAVASMIAGPALVIAGLVAYGVTEIRGVHYIKRGYENLVEKLRGIGAEITEEPIEDPMADTTAKAN